MVVQKIANGVTVYVRLSDTLRSTPITHQERHTNLRDAKTAAARVCKASLKKLRSQRAARAKFRAWERLYKNVSVPACHMRDEYAPFSRSSTVM